MKTSTRILGIVVAVVIGAALFAGGVLLGRASGGSLGYGFGLRGSALGFRMLNGFGFGGIIPPILTILFWVVVIAGGIWLIGSFVSRANSPAPSSQPSVESALDILKKRYARGELTKEQFDAMSREVAS